jgi:hypothetical protein
MLPPTCQSQTQRRGVRNPVKSKESSRRNNAFINLSLADVPGICYQVLLAKKNDSKICNYTQYETPGFPYNQRSYNEIRIL